MTRDLKNKNSLNLFLNDYFNIIMVGIVVVALAASYFLVIKPKYDATMLAIQSNIEQQQKLYAEQQKKLNSLKAIAELYKKIPAADLDKFNGVLPDTYVRERLFGELEEMVSRSGFVLNSVTIEEEKEEEPAASASGGEGGDGEAAPAAPAPVKTDGGIGTVTFRMAVSSIDYAGFKNLLKLLESNLRLFDVTDVSFSPGADTANFTLSTYYYKK